ncbi:MAG: hypothetical protein K8W52_20370 [Deltaproteobacteria bacterium]|nr:hypothetical protein [Deltaproteobacteria bacterium]
MLALGVAACDGGATGGPALVPGGPGGVPPAGFCAGTGPIIDLGAVLTPGSGDCDRDSFAAALCSCTDLDVKGYLAVSSRDPMLSTAGSVGANGDMQLFGYADVGGSVRVAGAAPLGFYGYLRTGAQLEVGGSVAVKDSGFAAGYLEVGGDAKVAGDIALLGYATIAGDLTQPAGALTPVVLDVAGARLTGAVDVAPPCACGESQIPDLAGLVADARTHNDDPAIGLAPGALRDVVGVAGVTLPCGHYYLDEISGKGLIYIKATGRVALHIGGDVEPTGLFVIEVTPGAEVDLVIGGSLRSTGALGFGALDRPGSLRAYVAGGGDVRLTGASGFAGNLYAPRAAIVGTGATFVNGSLFGRAIEIPGFLQVSYDPTVRGDCGIEVN